MHWGWDYYGWWWGRGLLMVVFWILVIVGIVYLVKTIAGTGRGRGREDETPLDILKKRYAKGEISKEEFEEKKKDIQ
ncbi:MAG: SHOCT domain-containing protein [Nitrospirota bacterium]